ncbi:VirB4 family type IV secretion system protein [Polaromonas sp.]|uniref:VirB4 family type IV secretion system protein n=1 Tax=Polaromonas sp. TaxID=1869339 RepID=UPI00272F0825|nr:type IV secretion system protein VirB4 [Polaromonas sp.]MDP2449591.1 type IV secretion system protein VirB4 [Polaromonas sp.]
MVSFEDLFTKPRKAARSFAELLPWFTQVAPGLVLCQDGSLLAGYTYEGADVEGKQDFEVDQRISQLQTALRALNDRITLWTIQERRFVTGYPSGEFTNPIAQAIDRQWEKACTKQRNAAVTQCMFLSFNFPNRSEAFFEAIRSEVSENDRNFLAAVAGLIRRRLTDKGAVARVRGQLSDMTVEFEKILDTFSGIVELNLGFSRLRDDEMLGELYARANLASPRGPVSVSKGMTYLNTALATDTLIRRQDQVEFQGPTKSTFVAALSTTGTPQEAFSGDVDRLMGVDCEYVLIQCYRFMDRTIAEKAIQDAEMFYRSEVKSVLTRAAERLLDTVSDKVNTGNLQLADDAQEALVELTASNVSYGYYNMTVLALGNSQKEAENAADLMASNLRASGYTIIRERQGLISALLTSMPGNANAIMRWKLASTANLADLTPIRTISTGEKTHPFFSRLLGYDVPPLCRFVTPYGISYDFNPHETDLGHTAIVGGAGSGKTSLLTLLIAQFQKYTPSQTFIFDKDHSLMIATVLLGGKHIDLGGKGGRKIGMNPVRVMLDANDDMRLRQWVEVLIAAGGSEVSATEGQAIFTAIQGLRRSHRSGWRLSALYALIAGADQTLAAKLAPYVDRTDDDDAGAGAYAPYFDNDEDNFQLSSMVGMECGGILQTPQLASPFMDYAFYNIESRLDGTTPTLIYIEEAWYMLANPMFAAKMEDWLRTFRKKRAFVMFATQALDELARLPNIGSFVTNIPCQILLPAVKSSVHQQAALYSQVFDINESQLNLLAHAIPKRDYLLVKPSVTRLVSTQMPPLLIAINEATTQPAMRQAVIEASIRGGPGWELKFVKEVLHVAA